MSRKNRHSRVCRASDKSETLSRPNRQKVTWRDIPLWLFLYHLDMEICASGFIRRRSLLRVRNFILGFYSVPSGSEWEVRYNAKER